MSGRNFGSLVMVASCAVAALGCYLVSLRVASERAALEDVETKIVLAQRDMRVIQTEIGTRGRLAQLERWNAKVLALSAPQADQFLNGGFELARLAQPEHKVEFQAPVVLASAPAPDRKAPIGQAYSDESGAAPPSVAPRAMLHEASFKTEITSSETREVPVKPTARLPQAEGAPKVKSTVSSATAAKPAIKKSVDKPGLAAAHPAKSVDKQGALAPKPVTKPVRLAKYDPLAPLPEKRIAHSSSKPSKDLHPAR
ncbi:hypothetical protein GCM10022276_24710 [Sphingomonas limnosediminicola]|uniref:Uncharacterized protein n=1 Tax=Sphingomonas limnosediminicola TaxID=940133 RepID=A0ABP7LPN6_9SPHN